MMVNMTTKRAIIYTRLSSYRGDSDPSTSPERQRETCTAYAAAKGWEVVDIVEDLDVSGSSRGLRLDRPGLKSIRNRYAEVDVVIFAKLDRLARNVRDFAALAEEAEARGVALVSVAESLDLTTPSGRFVSVILAAFAQMEAETMAERTAAGRAEAQRQGRWTGGTPPFGTRAVDNKGGSGRVLEPHPDEAPILRGMVTRYVTGDGYATVARWLNSSGIPTQRGGLWRGATVRTILHSHAIESAALTPPERHALKAALAERTTPTPTVPADTSRALLSGGVLRCHCGRAMPRKTSAKGRAIYICPITRDPSGVKHGRVDALEAEEYVTQFLLDDWGAFTPGVYTIPSEAHDLAIAAAADAVDDLRAKLASVDDDDDLDALVLDLKAARAELARLRALPVPRTPIYTPGNETVAEKWAKAAALPNEAERRKACRDILLDYVKVTCSPAIVDGRRLSTEERLTIPTAAESTDYAIVTVS